jgi:hypothetical protein
MNRVTTTGVPSTLSTVSTRSRSSGPSRSNAARVRIRADSSPSRKWTMTTGPLSETA